VRENPYSLPRESEAHKTPNTRHRPPQPKSSLTAADQPLGEHIENSLGNVAVVDRSGVCVFFKINYFIGDCSNRRFFFYNNER
jgi:hypothetical protein